MTVESAIRATLGTPGIEVDIACGGRFSDLVIRCLDLDETARSATGFCRHLRATILTFRLGRLFARNGDGEHHRTMIPRGYNRDTGAIIEVGMMQWRADCRSLAPERQMLAATVVWRYQHGADSTWLRRVPCTWGAAEALNYLRDAGCLADWQQLVATGPGG